MSELISLVKRNCKLFFKDKGMFFTSLITPIILLVLYATFLAKVYKESFENALPANFFVDEKIINATVSGQLISSLLAVCCVTVAFCSNLLMVQDKISGARRDLTMSPVKKSTLALSYFISSAIATLIICYTAFVACLIFMAFTGCYMSVADIFLLSFDILILTLFGTALSSLINCNLSSNGQASAVGTIVSAGYGFICGAYMPISSFSSGLQKVLSFFPGTYGTSLIRNHALKGVFSEMSKEGFPDEVICGMKDSIDCNIYFFDKEVSIGVMYAITIISVLVLIGGYVLLNMLKKKH